MKNLSEKEIRIKELAFLDKNIFRGLKNLNNGFDAKSIKYFSESDFEIVLNRVKELGLGIFGIEPWSNGSFYEVSIFEDYTNNSKDSSWYNIAFENFKKEGKGLVYSATYDIPVEILIEDKQI